MPAAGAGWKRFRIRSGVPDFQRYRRRREPTAVELDAAVDIPKLWVIEHIKSVESKLQMHALFVRTFFWSDISQLFTPGVVK